MNTHHRIHPTLPLGLAALALLLTGGVTAYATGGDAAPATPPGQHTQVAEGDQRPQPVAARTTSSPTRSAAAPAAPRVLPLDLDDPIREQWIAEWNQCLIDHGAATDGAATQRAEAAAAAGEQVDARYPVAAEPVPEDARAACRTLVPQLSPELSADTNPRFAAEAAEYVRCMSERGLQVRLLNRSNLDWTYREGHAVPEDSDAIEKNCLLGTFG